MLINHTRPAFWLAFLSTLFLPYFFPICRFFYFAPYLIICFYNFSKFEVLLRAFLCGILLDLLSSHTYFGITAINFCFVCLLLYPQKHHFFADKLSTLPLMTFLFSLLSTLFSLLLLSIQQKLTFFYGKALAVDFVIMPLLDALYSLIVFSLPFQLHYSFRRLRLRMK